MLLDSDPPSGAVDVVGIDTIGNDSPGWLIQRTTYERSINEAHLLSTSSKKDWEVTGELEAEAKWEASGSSDPVSGSLSAKIGGKYGSSKFNGDTIGSTQLVIVSMTREIRVEPFAAVQVCV